MSVGILGIPGTRYIMQILGIVLMLFIVVGCSKGAEETTQKVIDYGTGKTQVDMYQRLKAQIKTMNEENAQQFDQ